MACKLDTLTFHVGYRSSSTVQKRYISLWRFLLLTGIKGIFLTYVQKNTQEYLLSIIREFKVDNDSGQLGII